MLMMENVPLLIKSSPLSTRSLKAWLPNYLPIASSRMESLALAVRSSDKTLKILLIQRAKQPTQIQKSHLLPQTTKRRKRRKMMMHLMRRQIHPPRKLQKMPVAKSRKLFLSQILLRAWAAPLKINEK